MIRIGKERTPFRVLKYQLCGKRPVGRPRCRWVNNIERHIRDLGVEIVGGTGQMG